VNDTVAVIGDATEALGGGGFGGGVSVGCIVTAWVTGLPMGLFSAREVGIAGTELVQPDDVTNIRTPRLAHSVRNKSLMLYMLKIKQNQRDKFILKSKFLSNHSANIRFHQLHINESDSDYISR
jgi:hypothetical protein